MFQLWSFFSSIRSVTLLWICLLSPSDGFMTKSPYFATIHACSRYLPSSSRHQNNNQLMMNAPARVPNKRDRKVESILEAVDFSRRPVAPSTPLMDDPLMGMIGSILNAADARKATYLSAFRISSVTEITTFMVVIEGNSRPQNQAIALAVEDAVLLEYQQQTIKQGDAASGWILLDYGPVIVHIMTPQMRGFYKLEKRWKDAEVVDVASLLVNPGLGPGYDSAMSSEQDQEQIEQEDIEKNEEDPFWK